MVQLNPEHMLTLIEALVSEVNDHLDDEQGDQDRHDIDLVFAKILELLDVSPEEFKLRENPSRHVYFAVDGINRSDNRIYGTYSDFTRKKGSIRNVRKVFNEETHSWDETN